MMLAGLQTMSNDTMFGHVKFSYTQRNFGRSPILLQRKVRPACPLSVFVQHPP